MTNMGDMFFTAIMFGILLIPIILIIFALVAYKKSMKRAEEKLKIEKQQTFTLQNQVTDLTTRVEKLENLLREVD